MSRRWIWHLGATILLLFGTLLNGHEWPVHAESATPHCFTQTGFCIPNPAIWDYFTHRGGIATFGYPASRAFEFEGFSTQFFQRRITQIGLDGNARLLNILDPSLMPYTHFNGATFPAIDQELISSAPNPSDQAAILAFIKAHAPDSFQGVPINFYQTFLNTVSYPVAFPNGGDGSLLPGFDLEMWGLPTSLPAVDPNNHNFVYLRWQRGFMMYDASCQCTQGVLLGDYLKNIMMFGGGANITNRVIEAHTAGTVPPPNSPLLLANVYHPGAPNWIETAWQGATLPATDLTNAFTPDDPTYVASLGSKIATLSPCNLSLLRTLYPDGVVRDSIWLNPANAPSVCGPNLELNTSQAEPQMLLSLGLVQEFNWGYAEGGIRLSPGVADALAQLR